MRILMLGLNFWPEPTGIGKYSGEMVNFLQKAGHQVTVITAPPYYPYWQVQPPYDRQKGLQYETWNGASVIRCPLYVPARVTGLKRIIHLLSFRMSAHSVTLKELKKQPDLVFAVQPTLFAAALANARTNGKRPHTWLHIQDFELDAALNLGILKKIPFLESAARKWEKHVYSQFDVLSTISHAMADRLIEKKVPREKIHFFPNWIDTAQIFPLSGENQYRKELHIAANEIVLLYSGSIGQKQGAEVLIEAFKLLPEEQHFHLVICGEGPGKAKLQGLSRGIANIHFLPVQPVESLNELLNMADIHLLPQKLVATDLVMPSKLLGMLASGRPVIATCVKGSELHNTVKDIGVSVPPEHAGELAKAIVTLASDKSIREELGNKGRSFVLMHFSKEKILGSINDAFTELLSSTPL